MRPLRLSMQAFGPFADVVDLDFRELEGRSLFLIHGPTGAGKTTILDAMCFALFGEAAGSERKGKDARSHFAEPTVATEVTLEFALGAAHWRVRRVAEQARPGGATMKPPQATLERISAEGAPELRATRVREVDAAIRDLLGFEIEQFRQVVLLPQGEFRRLLVSDSKDREKILETLFGAELYRRIESELKRAGALLEREVLDARTRVDELLRLAGSHSREELRERCATQARRRAELDELAATLRVQSAAASRAVADAEKAVAAFHERDAALEARGALEKDTTAQARRRDELSAARRAQGLEALVERAANARASLDREQRKHEAAARALAAAETEATEAASALAGEEERGGEREAASALVRRLQQASDVASRLAQLRRAIAAAETRLADATGAMSLNGRDISYAEGRVDAADKELALLRPVVAGTEKRRVCVADLRRILTAVEQMAAARSFLLRQSVEAGGAQQRLAAAETNVAVCQAAEADAHRRWAGGQAALLARTLEAGAACPVCGSPEHPAPATSTDEVPTQADVEAARAAISAAREQVNVRQRELDKEKAKESELRRSVAVLEGTLGEHAEWTMPEAAAAFARAEAELIEAGKANARVFDLEAEKAKHLAAIDEARADQAAARERAAEQEQLLARDRALAAELQKSVPDELAGADVTALLAGAARRASAMSKAYDDARTGAAAAAAALTAAAASAARAGVDRQHTEAAVVAATSGLEHSLAGAGFSTAAELDAARRAAAEIDALESSLRRFDEALASSRARAQRAAAAVEGLEMPDVAAVRTQADAARAALDAALDENSRLHEALSMTERTLAQVTESSARIEEAERRYLAVGRVARISAGDNESGISFARFVLGALLDDVLAAATERLLRMSHGRFELVRAGDRRDRRRSGGLDLEVFDAHTGVARPAATLSGGEGFLASLSLALGLADVVQSHTGGIRLETMFVDEGFGTLDPEALDLAMGALEDLQAGGRLVGIISHVPELKERVGARLEVTPGRRGSTARFVG